MKKILLVLTSICLLLAGCEKYAENHRRYEEDHRRHLKTPLRRISQKWEIVNYQINGIDYLSTCNFVSNRIEFKQVDDIVFWIVLPDTYTPLYEWQFRNEESQIRVDVRAETDSTYDSNPFLYLVDTTISANRIGGDWTIKKLTNKEFALESFFQNNLGEIRIEMERIKG